MRQQPTANSQQLVCYGLCCLVMIALAGCNPPLTDTSSALAVSTTTIRLTTIEAGIVLADRPGYLCLPIPQVGLLPDDQIVSLSSSCECIQPRLVAYHNSSHVTDRAVLLEFVDEAARSHDDSATDASNRTVASLGVIIEATLADGRRHEFTVSLLHSYLNEEQQR